MDGGGWAMTTIQDTITYADGTVGSGQIVVTWPPFSVNSVTIIGGQQAFLINPDGTVSITLYPTANAGVYYTASYQLDRGPVYTEYWNVPALPNPTSIAAIRTIPEMPQ